jgi:hypothetical protein
MALYKPLRTPQAYPGGECHGGVVGVSYMALTRDGDLGIVNRLWLCLAGVFRWFDGFGGREGRSTPYIFAAEHGLVEPWPGWCGKEALLAGAIGSPQRLNV